MVCYLKINKEELADFPVGMVRFHTLWLGVKRCVLRGTA